MARVNKVTCDRCGHLTHTYDGDMSVTGNEVRQYAVNISPTIAHRPDLCLSCYDNLLTVVREAITAPQPKSEGRPAPLRSAA